jgi:hypothetical protein
MTETMTETIAAFEAPVMLEDTQTLDPLADAEEANAKNRAKVGTARPSSLLYTYGPGSIMDLPNFSVMPAGLDDWEPIWRCRSQIPVIAEPRLLDVVRLHLGPQVDSLRPYPWQPSRGFGTQEGSDLGIPARVFPQWLRCTGCDYLGPLPRFTYENTHPFRPDRAEFTHTGCPGRSGQSFGKRKSSAVPTPHLLTCTNGHLDEFPYALWVHNGLPCPNTDPGVIPDLKMRDANLGKSVGSTISCGACGAKRGMAEAQGEVGKQKLPQTCRGRHPHLGAFDPSCDAKPTLIMMGASNLWFPSTQSVIVMPRTDANKTEAIADHLRAELGLDSLRQFGDQIAVIRALAAARSIDLIGVTDADIHAIVADALKPADSVEERMEKLARWDPVELLVSEWDYLQRPTLFAQQENSSGLMVTEMPLGDSLRPGITRVVAVNKMKKINAVLGFTRLDEMDRAGDLASRLVKLTRDRKPRWVPATEDRGEGIFLQLDLNAVEAWERQVLGSALWEAHRAAHYRNFKNRYSETAQWVNPDTRLPKPRYWLLHTLAHILIREMAMLCGYGAASLSERIYGWSQSANRAAAAGLLICTTASDSEGTLGGLVALSDPVRLQGIVESALRRACRCSSDPLCATRTPGSSEDFLHGAACHCCAFASETSCERSNRFLDRRFLLDLPQPVGEPTVPGFFGRIYA